LTDTLHHVASLLYDIFSATNRMSHEVCKFRFSCKKGTKSDCVMWMGTADWIQL